MKEKEFFEEKVIEAAEILIDIKDVHKRKLNDIKKLYKHATGRKAKDLEKLAKYQYFKAGIPNEKSPGKFTKLMEEFVQIAVLYKEVGKENEIVRVLNNFGIEIKIDEARLPVGKTNQEKFDMIWQDLYAHEDVSNASVPNLIPFLLEQATNQLGLIESLKQDVKEGNAGDVELKCEVPPSVFTKAASLQMTKLLGKDVSEKIKKIEDKADFMSQAIDVIES